MGLFFDTLFAPTPAMSRETALRIYYVFKATFAADELNQPYYDFNYRHAYDAAAKTLDDSGIKFSTSVEKNIGTMCVDMLMEDIRLNRQSASERTKAFVEHFNAFYPGYLD